MIINSNTKIMFKHDCFIRKNSEYLRKSLDLIGKRNLCNIHDGILITHSDKHYSLLDCNETIEIMLDDGLIDCGTNEELFLAIAALRDDSDKHQFFVLETTVNQWSENCKPVGYFVKCIRDKWFFDFDKSGNPSTLSERNISAHKATVEELIEHFNK